MAEFLKLFMLFFYANFLLVFSMFITSGLLFNVKQCLFFLVRGLPLLLLAQKCCLVVTVWFLLSNPRPAQTVHPWTAQVTMVPLVRYILVVVGGGVVVFG